MIRSSKITNRLLASVLAVCGATVGVNASAAEKVTVQLKWLPLAQFAGYYVAQS
jgi:NitT/TauT family transport system substrate-binding protein